METGFYRAFEERHRGARELIAGRLGVYLPFARAIAGHDAHFQALDLGCGRGEWLELLAADKLPAHGIDLDAGMLSACRERGLDARQADALGYLQGLPAHSLNLLSGFHIAEHLEFAALQTLVGEACRVLKPGGLLLLETPNPENLAVGACDFYIDPTHRAPLPPKLLAFLPEHLGFRSIKVLRLQEDAELRQAQPGLYQVLTGASPDYAVLAQAPGRAAWDADLEELLAVERGLDMRALSARYDRALADKFVDCERQLQAQSGRIEHLLLQTDRALGAAEHARKAAEGAQAQADRFAAELRQLLNSRSWRLTRPLRWIAGKFAAWRRLF